LLIAQKNPDNIITLSKAASPVKKHLSEVPIGRGLRGNQPFALFCPRTLRREFGAGNKNAAKAAKLANGHGLRDAPYATDWRQLMTAI